MTGELFSQRCYAAYGVTDDPQEGAVPWTDCLLRLGHDGPHEGRNGYEWRDSDEWAWLPSYDYPFAGLRFDFTPPTDEAAAASEPT